MSFCARCCCCCSCCGYCEKTTVHPPHKSVGETNNTAGGTRGSVSSQSGKHDNDDEWEYDDDVFVKERVIVLEPRVEMESISDQQQAAAFEQTPVLGYWNIRGVS